jgi:hypothetical protein
MLGRGMSFVLYGVVLAVSISSVMMGLDWLSTPPPPVPKSAQVARAPATPAAPALAVKTSAAAKVAKTKAGEAKAGGIKAGETKTAKTKTIEDKTAATTAAATKTAEITPAAPKPVDATTGEASAMTAANDQAAGASDSLNIMVDEAKDGGADAQANAAPRCDVPACAAHYRSFNAADCTYQPYDGPRRLCTLGNPPKQADVAPTGVQTSDASEPPASSSCNVQACAAAYRSFDAATCTWQPFDGPRRACTK